MSWRRMWSSAIAVALVGTAIATSLVGGAGHATGKEQVLFAAGNEDTIGPLALTASRSSARQAGPSTIAAPVGAAREAASVGAPRLLHLRKSGRSFDGNLKNLPQTVPVREERPEKETPESPGGSGELAPINRPDAPAAPAPSPIQNFAAMTFNFERPTATRPTRTATSGPNHFIQTINTSIGIYDKSGRPHGRVHLQHVHEPGRVREPLRHGQLRRPGRRSTTRSTTAGSSPTSRSR